MWLYATFTGLFAGTELVIVGGVPITMLKAWVDAGANPFDAVTVPLNVPSTVGVPDSTPAVLRLRPVGRVPEVTAKVIVAVPVAV